MFSLITKREHRKKKDRHHSFFEFLKCVFGHIFFCLIPSTHLSKNTKIEEKVMIPQRVKHNWLDAD